MEAAKLEPRLSTIFQIAQQWHAVLLLDEADVFLEKRSSQNLTRNSLVSVFLRKLEYCIEILFLTTNRVTEFDDAIITTGPSLMDGFPVSSAAFSSLAAVSLSAGQGPSGQR